MPCLWPSRFIFPPSSPLCPTPPNGTKLHKILPVFLCLCTFCCLPRTPFLQLPVGPVLPKAFRELPPEPAFSASPAVTQGEGGLPGPWRQAEPEAAEPFSEPEEAAVRKGLSALALMMAVAPTVKHQCPGARLVVQVPLTA